MEIGIWVLWCAWTCVDLSSQQVWLVSNLGQGDEPWGWGKVPACSQPVPDTAQVRICALSVCFLKSGAKCGFGFLLILWSCSHLFPLVGWSSAGDCCLKRACDYWNNLKGTLRGTLFFEISAKNVPPHS